MRCVQREAPSLPLQFNTTRRFMHTILFVEHTAYSMSGAIYQISSVQSVLIVSVHTLKEKGPAEVFTHEECKSVGNEK